MNRGRKIALSEEQIQRAEKAKEKILADMISEQEQRLSLHSRSVSVFLIILNRDLFLLFLNLPVNQEGQCGAQADNTGNCQDFFPFPNNNRL